MKDMKRKQILFSILLLFSVVATQAARVDTIMVKSPSMNKEVQVVYVLPDKALGEKAEACPVVYLLHGYGGNARTWIGIKPELPKIADEKGIILYVLMVKTVGTGIVLRIRLTAMKLL